jgi:hypothetical protein
MKKFMTLFLVVILLVGYIYVIQDKKPLTARIDPSCERFNFNMITDEIISRSGRKYSVQNNYLIDHWTPKFVIEITREKMIKDLTLSLAMEKRDGSYDIYQIGKSGEDELSINLVDKRERFEELNNPVKADALFNSLNSINWTGLFDKIPEAGFYLLRSWGGYERGEKIEVSSGPYHSLSPRITYISKQEEIEEFNDYDKSMAAESILSVIVPVYGSTGNADIGLLIELGHQ